MSLFSNIWQKITGKRKWEEKRKYIRLKAHHLLKYKVLDKDAELSFAKNISAGGVLFYSREEVSLGSTVEMEILFPQYPNPIKVVAKIVWKKPVKNMEGFDLGAEFINVEEDAKNFINDRILAIDKEMKEKKS